MLRNSKIYIYIVLDTLLVQQVLSTLEIWPRPNFKNQNTLHLLQMNSEEENAMLSRTGNAYYNEVLKIQYITFKRWQSKGPCRGGNWQQKPRRQRATEWRGSSSFPRRSRLVRIRIRIKCCQDSGSCHRVRLEPGGATGSFARLGEILGRRSGGGWRSGVLTLPPPPHSQAGLTPGRFSFFFCFCFDFAFQFQRGIAHRCTIFLC